MDKGKGKIGDASHPEFTPRTSTAENHWKTEALKNRRDSEYWRNAYMDLYAQHMESMSQERIIRDCMAAKHQYECQELGNMIASLRRQHQDTLEMLHSQLDARHNQMITTIKMAEGVAREYAQDANALGTDFETSSRKATATETAPTTGKNDIGTSNRPSKKRMTAREYKAQFVSNRIPQPMHAGNEDPTNLEIHDIGIDESSLRRTEEANNEGNQEQGRNNESNGETPRLIGGLIGDPPSLRRTARKRVGLIPPPLRFTMPMNDGNEDSDEESEDESEEDPEEDPEEVPDE